MLERDKVKAFYDGFGKKEYSQAFYEDPVVEEIVRHADIVSAEAVVEFGCGTGRFVERLARGLNTRACVTPPGFSNSIGWLDRL